ncbi:MAG: pyridoxamine 5'-phosphate oxidase family protein [Acidobacteria bacterium]|jgi:general stress protein 26|nr:pyridoxamine 5'-phosphate oxidase family protein [Acidobacteriota bacterium]
MADKLITNYEDVTVYGLDTETEDLMHEQQKELTFCWTTKDGSPMASILSYFRKDGIFWMTSAAHRKRVPAIRRDPRVALVITSTGQPMGGGRTVTYKGTARVLDDRATKEWFYPALADRLYGSNPERAAEFAKMLDSPDRIIIEVTPGLRVGYDGAKMAAATTRSREAGVLKNL